MKLMKGSLASSVVGFVFVWGSGLFLYCIGGCMLA